MKVTVGASWLITVAAPVTTHVVPLSVTSTVYVSADNPEISSDVALFGVQTNSNGPTPPVTVKSTVPFVLPQVAFVAVSASSGSLVLVIVKELSAEHPFASVTVSVYVLAANPEISSVVSLEDQLYV